jgi:hypothetical protein
VGGGDGDSRHVSIDDSHSELICPNIGRLIPVTAFRRLSSAAGAIPAGASLSGYSFEEPHSKLLFR